MLLTQDRTLRRIGDLCEAATDPRTLMGEAGTILAEAVDADAFVMLRLDPQSSVVLEAFEGADPQQRCTAYAERAFLRGAFGDFGAMALGDQRLFTVDEGQAGDPYVDHVMRPFGYRQELLVSLAHDRHPYGQLFLSRHAGPFDRRVHALVESAVAPITGALRRLHAEETLQAVPGGSVALFFVDQDGSLTPASEHARDLLDRCNHRVYRSINSPLQFLAALVARDLRGELGDRPLPSSIFVDPDLRHRYRVVAERMLGNKPRAMLVVEPIRAIDSVDLLRHAGLTEREAEVALATLRGLTSARGALSLRISEHTFLSHLKAVYRKLGVGSRGELSALLCGVMG